MNPLILYDLLYYYPFTTLFVHGVGGEWHFYFIYFFFFTNRYAGSYIYTYIGIDRLTITPEIFDSGGIHSYGHVLFGGIK